MTTEPLILNIVDLPNDVFTKIAGFLKETNWIRDELDIVQDTVALTLSCKGLQSLADCVRDKSELDKFKTSEELKTIKTKCICKSEVKSTYKLTDAQLDDIPYVEKGNPYYRCAAPMKLFKVRDVKRAWYLKYHDEQTFNSIQDKKQLSKEKAQLTKTAKIEKRRSKLKEALAARGCSLRGDSRLCDNYIDHGKGKPDEIAIVMEEMKFYYEKTRYTTFFEQEKRGEYEYKGYFNADEVSETAKSMALSDWKERNKHNLDSLPESLKGP